MSSPPMSPVRDRGAGAVGGLGEEELIVSVVDEEHERADVAGQQDERTVEPVQDDDRVERRRMPLPAVPPREPESAVDNGPVGASAGPYGKGASATTTGSPQGDRPGNVLYVRGLHPSTTEMTLREVFSKHGKVTEVHLVMDPRTRRSREFAFVTFETDDEATRAAQSMHGAQLDSHRISCEKARRTRPRTPTPGQYMGIRERELEIERQAKRALDSGVRDVRWGRMAPPSAFFPPLEPYAPPFGMPIPPPYMVDPYGYGPRDYERDSRGRDYRPSTRRRDERSSDGHSRSDRWGPQEGGYQSRDHRRGSPRRSPRPRSRSRSPDGYRVRPRSRSAGRSQPRRSPPPGRRSHS